MNNKVLFAHTKEDWGTPDKLFDALHAKYNFYMDLAASESNTKLARFTNDLFNFDFDTIPSGSSLWLNPPYGSKAKDFIATAVKLWREGFRVVCLLPARTDTKWFHDLVLPNADIEFLRGRITFKDALNPAPFPSMIVVFHHDLE